MSTATELDLDDYFETEEQAIDRALRQLLMSKPPMVARIKSLCANPCSDRELIEWLKDVIGKGLSHSATGKLCSIRATPKLALWIGCKAGQGKAALESRQLLDRIRVLLQVPDEYEPEGRPVEEAADETAPAPKSAAMQVIAETGITITEESFLDEADVAQFAQDPTPDEVENRLNLEENAPELLAVQVSDTQLSLFDYADLEPETRTIVQQRTIEIKNLARATTENIIEIGYKLAEVKSQLKHGQWLPWLKREFQWSAQQASRWINVAQQFGGQKQQIVEFDLSALYALASSSVSEGARTEALERAKSGEHIDKGAAEEIVERYREMEEPEPELVQLELAGAEPEAAAEAEAVIPAGAVVGVCRVCGCTEDNACVSDEGPCARVAGTGDTLCTSCQALMESRGLDEATLRARVQSRAIDRDEKSESAATPEELANHLVHFPGQTRDSLLAKGVDNTVIEEALCEGLIEMREGRFHVGERPREIDRPEPRESTDAPAKPRTQQPGRKPVAKAKPAVTGAATKKAQSPAPKKITWDRAIVNINFGLQPDDGDRRGRRVVVGVHVTGLGPVLEFLREDDIGDFAPPIAALIARVKEELPAKVDALGKPKVEASKPAPPKKPVKRVTKPARSKAKPAGKSRAKAVNKSKPRRRR